jgi:hypothetical protein
MQMTTHRKDFRGTRWKYPRLYYHHHHHHQPWCDAKCEGVRFMSESEHKVVTADTTVCLTLGIQMHPHRKAITLKTQEGVGMAGSIGRWKPYRTLLTLRGSNFVCTSYKNWVFTSRESWMRVHIDSLTLNQLVDKFAAFRGTRMSITAFTRAHSSSLYLLWARRILSTPPIST